MSATNSLHAVINCSDSPDHLPKQLTEKVDQPRTAHSVGSFSPSDEGGTKQASGSLHNSTSPFRQRPRQLPRL